MGNLRQTQAAAHFTGNPAILLKTIRVMGNKDKKLSQTSWGDRQGKAMNLATWIGP